MPENKTVTYTIEIDMERYKTLPIWGYGGVGYPVGSFEATAEVLLATLGHPPEITDSRWNTFHEGNYKAILAWINKLDPEGISQLYSVNDPTQNPISWTIKTQIRGIP